VDRDTGCVETLKSLRFEFTGFSDFRIMQRQASDLADFEQGGADLIVLNNALHEISPHLYPELFSNFNCLLQPVRGRICVVDMESLPADSPEAIAINWSAAEVRTFLRAAGFSPEVTLHQKQTIVYQAHARHVPEGIDEGAIRLVIREMLLGKLNAAINLRRQLDAALARGADEFRSWLVITGSIARLSEVLAAMSASDDASKRNESGATNRSVAGDELLLK